MTARRGEGRETSVKPAAAYSSWTATAMRRRFSGVPVSGVVYFAG